MRELKPNPPEPEPVRHVYRILQYGIPVIAITLSVRERAVHVIDRYERMIAADGETAVEERDLETGGYFAVGEIVSPRLPAQERASLRGSRSRRRCRLAALGSCLQGGAMSRIHAAVHSERHPGRRTGWDVTDVAPTVPDDRPRKPPHRQPRAKA